MSRDCACRSACVCRETRVAVRVGSLLLQGSQSAAAGEAGMTSLIPGFEDEDDGPVLSFSRKRVVSAPDEEASAHPPKKAKGEEDEEWDEEDRELYGEEVASTVQKPVSSRTLVTEKLPLSETEFVCRLLSQDLTQETERQRLAKLFDAIKKLSQVDVTNVFQVAFMTCLTLEAGRRVESLPDTGFTVFYPYFKEKMVDSTLRLSCFSVTCKNDKSSPTFGQLVSVKVTPLNDSVEVLHSLAYVLQDDVRLHDSACRLEVDVMRHGKRRTKETLIREVVLLFPFIKELYDKTQYTITVAPVCAASDLMMQCRAIFHVPCNPFFRYLQTKNFDLLPTGLAITSDDSRFSPHELEAIQRSFDLVMQTPCRQGNPCKAVLINGPAINVRRVLIEFLSQVLSHEITREHQYVVASTSDMLNSMLRELKSKHLNDVPLKRVFLVGQEDHRIWESAKLYLESEMDYLQKTLADVSDNKKKSRLEHLKECLPFLQSLLSGAIPSETPADVQVTISHFRSRGMIACLKSARVILVSVVSLAASPDVQEYLSRAKVHAIGEETPPSEKTGKCPLLSVTMIADAESLTDLEIMSFASEFNFTRFILTSAWFDERLQSERRPDVSPFRLEQRFVQRLSLISQTSSSSLVLDVK